MKIISYGNIKPKRLTCPFCEAVFEYVQMDEERCRCAIPEGEYVIIGYCVLCPVCQKVIKTREERW